MTDKPLAGLRVLDFTRLYAGPFCTMLLGDLGADVVKVESPEGDAIRRQGPPFHADNSFGFLAANRNKRSIVLDLKAAQDQGTIQRLAAKADVIVENFRPGVMERLGLGYEALAAERPRLVYASMSGMGRDGPSKDVGAFDLTIQAEGGYMSLTGERSGAPIKLGTSAFDLVCGQYAMGAIMTALFVRERTGRGQLIETSLFEGQITYLMDAAMEYLVTGVNRGKWGSEHSTMVPYKAFQAADGWIVIGAGHPKVYEAFLRVLGREDIGTDPRFATMSARNENRDALYEILDGILASLKVEDLLARLSAAGVPASPVNNMAQVFAHPQALHRGMLQTLRHPTYGDLPTIGPAVKYGSFDITEGWTAPPLLGEHTQAVLRDWLGDDPSALG
ncbi:CaiB/BaiF CoA-transferase family protein [Acidisphaera sp. L21]|uniref:CaiB/BaiF CoA transferase family protein n=1 Tax=Acidisphaera sp. L21 TaxID=1641851 RepID=UPI00131CF6CA|nr:CoA transferase [Acidisphaera sp. L21]